MPRERKNAGCGAHAQALPDQARCCRAGGRRLRVHARHPNRCTRDGEGARDGDRHSRAHLISIPLRARGNVPQSTDVVDERSGAPATSSPPPAVAVRSTAGFDGRKITRLGTFRILRARG
jgi:hypothetical protein